MAFFLNIYPELEMTAPSIYFHIPFCRGKCRYCGFYSTDPTDPEQIDDLLETELKELDKRLQAKPGSEIPTIYIGGGSPSYIEELPHFLWWIRDVLDEKELSYDQAEITVEINPGDVNRDFLSQLAEAGVNRISIGSQSFNDKELKMLGRRHNSEQIAASVDLCREVGLTNISLDLIFALPKQSIDLWLYNLQKAIELNPKHISIYSLTWEPDTEFELLRNCGKISPADDELDREMYYLAVDTLEQAGIIQYEISNFAVPGFESRHNLRYWDDMNYIGIGPSAGSHANYARWSNIADTDEYIYSIRNNITTSTDILTLDHQDIVRQAAILALRKRSGINIDYFKSRYGVYMPELFQNEIAINIKAGILEYDDNNIRLTRKGLSFADTVAQELI